MMITELPRETRQRMEENARLIHIPQKARKKGPDAKNPRKKIGKYMSNMCLDNKMGQ